MIPMKIKSSNTIAEVKALYEEKEGIPTEQIRILLPGYLGLLEDEKTVESYKIGKDSILHEKNYF